jgi:hypothetical protein
MAFVLFGLLVGTHGLLCFFADAPRPDADPQPRRG